jgi:transcriptional regulator with XRE-family HTH domain
VDFINGQNPSSRCKCFVADFTKASTELRNHTRWRHIGREALPVFAILTVSLGHEKSPCQLSLTDRKMSMIIDIDMAEEFAEFFGEAFEAFLREKRISEAEASKRMGILRGTLNTYTAGANGTRRRPPAELLAKACVLLGFEFEYEGYIIAARKDGHQPQTEEKQLHLQFTRQIDLEENGAITIGLKKPPGKVQLSFSLRAIS